jgi:polysaccharide export outer membrane protein
MGLRLLTILLLALASFCAIAVQSEATLAPQDEVVLTCQEEPAIDGTYMVTEDGFLLVPFVGALQVEGLTRLETAALVSERLVELGIVESASVRVQLPNKVPPTPQVVTIQGEVEEPGEYPIEPEMRLSEALGEAQPTEDADLAAVSITSATGGTVRLDLTLELPEEALNDPILRPGDAILVPTKEEEPEPEPDPVSISGEVINPGQYSLEEPAPIAEVIAQAGGFSVDADLSRILINRGDETILVDFEQSAQTAQVQPGDSITVPQRVILGYVQVEGAVRNPSTLEYTEGLTLRRAVALAGGVRPGISDQTALLYREGLEEPIELPLRQILQGLSGRFALQIGDRIVIPEQATRR